MKVFSIRVPDQVCDKLKKMDTKVVRQRLTEIAGFTYNEEKRLIIIEEMVKRFLKENIDQFELKEKDGDETMTSKAMDSILQIMS